MVIHWNVHESCPPAEAQHRSPSSGMRGTSSTKLTPDDRVVPLPAAASVCAA
jgi:hypothetical protein